jgi:hypothetical protein
MKSVTFEINFKFPADSLDSLKIITFKLTTLPTLKAKKRVNLNPSGGEVFKLYESFQQIERLKWS